MELYEFVKLMLKLVDAGYVEVVVDGQVFEVGTVRESAGIVQVVCDVAH